MVGEDVCADDCDLGPARGAVVGRGIAAMAATAGVLVAPEQLDAVDKTFIAIIGPAALVSPGRKAA